MDLGRDDEDGSIVAQLIRHWSNERNSPDILPFESELIERALQFINDQGELVLRLQTREDTSEEEHFKIMLVQTEMERVKFVVRSYLRARLFKIEKFAPFILSSRAIQTRLSAMELSHALKYGEIIASQFNTAVLQHLPEDMRALTDERQTFVPAIMTQPDKSNFVFTRARQDIIGLRDLTGKEIPIARGATIVATYRLIEDALSRGSVELL